MIAALALAGVRWGAPSDEPAGVDTGSRRVIVQASDAAVAAERVREVGGAVIQDLGIIDAVAADLTGRQLEALARAPGVRRLYADSNLKVSGAVSNIFLEEVAGLIGADRLHQQGIDGRGVTVAVLDTGWWYSNNDMKRDLDGKPRILAEYNAVNGKLEHIGDDLGHGTHVTSIAVSSRRSADGSVLGVAPNARLVEVKAFDEQGVGTYADVIAGLDWIVANRARYGIRVLNLSFSAPPRSHYWDDPLNQAVMAAWKAGIVVVVSAGNGGPEAMTIGVPGNVPYVVTVGAMSDAATPEYRGDDFLATFSAAGPTVEGFVKPEIVAPGGHLLGIMDDGIHLLAQNHPEWVSEEARLFTMSGTSQSAAVVTGVVALMLQATPGLSPDAVKCRLMASARPALNPNGTLAYSVFQQGAGVVDAYDAVRETAAGCANRGLDAAADLAGTRHFGGRANQRADGDFYVMDLSGADYRWDGSYTWTGAYLWSDAFLWNDAFLWSDAYLWNDAYLWSDAFLWSDAYLWSDRLTEPMSVNAWVEQE